MSFEAPTHGLEDYDHEFGSSITITEQECVEFAKVKERIWARIIEEINILS